MYAWLVREMARLAARSEDRDVAPRARRREKEAGLRSALAPAVAQLSRLRGAATAAVNGRSAVRQLN